MTEREYLVVQLAKVDPEDKSLSQDSLINMGVKEMRILLRKYNADRNRGELNCQFKEWIIEKEAEYTAKIANIYKVGNHKVQLAYYGMIYTILYHAGCYLKGKNSNPIFISRDRYCEELNLVDRLGSQNVRKTIANSFYGHNYVLVIAARENGEKVRGYDPTLTKLEPIFKELANEVKDRFLD